MNKLVLKNSRHIDLCMDDVVYRNDNKITTIFIIFPDKIDEYPRKDCNVELRAILPNGGYLPYNIPTAEGKTSFLITNDLTEAAQVVKLMMIITHNGNVIGSTNEQEINVKEPTKTLEPLTPRAEFDEVIAEQRATITVQEQTITQQASQISEDAETISGLNTQVGELETENTTLSNQNETYRQTIQNFIDNPPAPKLETLEAINPSTEQVTYIPSGDNVGFNAFTVNGVTPFTNLDNWLEQHQYGELFELITNANSFGEYIAYKQTRLSKVVANNAETINTMAFFNCSTLQEFQAEKLTTLTGQQNFDGCSNLVTFNAPNLENICVYCFQNCYSLKNIDLSKIKQFYRYDFASCALETIFLNSATLLGVYTFFECANLKTVFISNKCISADGMPFVNCTSLEFVTLENGFNANNLNLSSSILYSHDTILGMFIALADRTGLTAYTLIIGPTNSAKMTAEEIAIATNKNWNIA